MLILFGCALSLKPQFVPLRDLPPQALKTVIPDDVEVMSGEPPIGKEYVELAYIILDESKVSPIMSMSVSDKDIIEMVRKEAANHGADAVIRFKITGDHPARKATGVAIVYIQ